MSAAVISTLIFASPGASAFSGSQGSLPERVAKTVRASRGLSNADHADRATRSESDPCSTFERCNYLAGRRLKIIGKREQRIVALLVRIHKLQGGDASAVEQQRRHVAGGVRGVICSVFGAHCSEAISVATCESTLRVTARNGDYWGLFQFGSFARAHYGFAWDALTQARAAYRYWRDAGWSPWQCQP